MELTGRMAATAVVSVCGLMALAVSGCRVPVDPGSLDPGGGGGGGPTPTPTPTSPTPPADAESCVSPDLDHLCYGLKLVAYVDKTTGKPTVTEAQARGVIQKVNAVWAPCDIAFQLEDYQAIDPTVVGLSYGSGSQSQLNSIRYEFGNNSTFLVVVTGPWSGSTIAWTTMPGAGPFGVIVERDYGDNPFTVGHELGHYQGLYHVGNSSNLMNAYIGSNTSGLTSNQCEIARETDLYYWTAMRRL